MNKYSWRLAAVFSLAVFTIILSTMILNGFLTMLAFRLGIIKTHNRDIILIGFAIISIIVGTLFTRFGGRRMIGPIIEISEATKEIAKGNFDIQLKENSRAKEVNIMAHNFMLMAKELSNIETFHNDFISNVSHEFKTPISAIEGYATLLQNKNLSEEKQDAYIAKILFNVKRLSSLTGNILQLSRLEKQEMIIEKKWFSLDEQIRQDVLMFETTWSKKDLELDIDLDVVNYFGNSDLISQVWQNLIGNAMKFVEDRGCIRIILKQEAENAVISISDNGIGMSPDVKKRIFEKFYQGDTSHSSDGNGLGLTLVKRIVDLHDGTINVSTKEGKGTTFTVHLPLKPH